MNNLLPLEWNKLKKKLIVLEAIIYLVSIIGVTFLFLVVIDFGIHQSYTSTINFVNLVQRMTFTLFGASLINQVIINEYKNKTISIIFSYPIKREIILLSKILLIFICIFVTSLISYMTTGSVIYLTDLTFNIITGLPAYADFTKFALDMIIQSVATACISLIPLFYFAIVKRATVATIICAIVVMQLQNVSVIFGFHQEFVVVGLTLIGVISVLLSISTFKRFGRIS